MSLYNYRDVLYMCTVVWVEQGAPHSHYDAIVIPLLATNDMTQPGCVCYTSI